MLTVFSRSLLFEQLIHYIIILNAKVFLNPTGDVDKSVLDGWMISKGWTLQLLSSFIDIDRVDTEQAATAAYLLTLQCASIPFGTSCRRFIGALQESQ